VVCLSSAPAALAEPKDTLTIDLVADVSTMDPQLQLDTDAYSVYRNIFDNLLTRDASVRSCGCGTMPTTLRSSSISAMTSPLGRQQADARRCRLQRQAHPQSGLSRTRQLSPFDQIIAAEVTGSDQVTLHTRTPDLAHLVKLSILPEAVVRKLGDQAFNQQPVGSGPYRLDIWQHGVQSVLQANESYWRGNPPFKTAIFCAIPDGATRVANLRSNIPASRRPCRRSCQDRSTKTRPAVVRRPVWPRHIAMAERAGQAVWKSPPRRWTA
jgi:peptide/nickel transport system substrate-binding protein